MNAPPAQVFDLPQRLAAKADPSLIATDEKHFAAIGRCLEQSIAELSRRLDLARTMVIEERESQEALDRDQQVHRLSARLRTLSRFGLDLCLGRMVSQADSEPLYIGRLGLTDNDGQQLLIDWRSPAAEPFFGATHGNPMGLESRRRYRWQRGRINDYWDEVFTADGLAHSAALDDQSAFIASLGTSRSAQMRDVLATIQSDQDAIIRADSAGALVVDGGPGTGKTVVALHRAAYLLYSDPRLGHHRGGVLVVGPHHPYLSYVADVLPSLGEEGVQTATVADLVAEGANAGVEADPEVVRLKSSAELVKAIEPAVTFYEEPPKQGMTVSTSEADIWLSAEDWASAFDIGTGNAHNEMRDHILDELVTILLDKVTDDIEDGKISAPEQLRKHLLHNEELNAALNKAWPLIEPTDLVADLWSVPAYLRLSAPWLNADEVHALQRDEPYVWTVSDLPLLDAARQRLGDSQSSRRKRQLQAQIASERAEVKKVIEHLVASDDTEMQVMSMLGQDDFHNSLVDVNAIANTDSDQLSRPFAHIIVDEAQELTDAQWQMLLARCPSRSFTVVGDRAQARNGFTESWQERLERVGLDRINLMSLTVNYRTPQPVMAEAEPVILTALPDANVPTSIRTDGQPVTRGPIDELDSILKSWLHDHSEGVACVITPDGRLTGVIDLDPRVQLLSPELSKGLEFDLVVLVDADRFGDGIQGAVDRYVAMTRATAQLVILTST